MTRDFWSGETSAEMIERDQMNQDAFDEANLLRSLPTLGLTLIGCLLMVGVLDWIQTRWRRR